MKKTLLSLFALFVFITIHAQTIPFPEGKLKGFLMLAMPTHGELA
ncbi:hypothetical protein [Flavobacterium noncentrifugens]|nr:hypothetical protein [Flavobacterium noncentrifugens]